MTKKNKIEGHGLLSCDDLHEPQNTHKHNKKTFINWKIWGWWFYNWWWDIQLWNFACEIWLLILASVLEIFFLVGCNFKSRDYFQHFFQRKVVISHRKKREMFSNHNNKRNCSLSRKKYFWWSCFFLLHLHPMIVWRQPRPLFSQQQTTPPLNILAH